VHQATHVLANTEQRPVTTLKRADQPLLETMRQHQDGLGALAPAVAHVQKVIASSWDGLLHYSQVKDLPRTTHDLEQNVGAARQIERRVTGRTRASPSLVVRGSVRVVAAGASRLASISAVDVRLMDVVARQARRQTLNARHESRRRQLRFRRDPQASLTSLEESLFRSGLPS
jgi:hypothetical protein